ncbi:exodeoxyribonuclease VII small subunit [Moraxella marmotae]|uniref:exodeoxyribonuclease VII small subunit n=1 Tax=Moraxella marmotae TaxID=3344520 RepID=UPI0035F2E25C
MSQTTDNALSNFKDAYEILKTNAEKLERSDALDIDNLVCIVEESLAAYRVCQSRIDAVESALKAAFAEADGLDTEV